jgi:hypothetical protein
MKSRTARRSAMHATFNAESLNHDWSTFIGQPMLYDGALFVEREKIDVPQHRVLQSLLANTPKTKQ